MSEAKEEEQENWPDEVLARYDRIDVLGKGSFGMVWMSKRKGPAENEYDEEYVAIKRIVIKDEKSEVYAEREISVLEELNHPNVIRLIRSYPAQSGSRVVVMQLARGPNLHQLVIRRGALGMPLCRMISRQLIAAVSYLHGRAVIHRDIKPSNCILHCNTIPVTEEYDWLEDDAIWSTKEDCAKCVKANKWKLMLIDFGFARPLEETEISEQKHMRNSIVYEQTAPRRVSNKGSISKRAVAVGATPTVAEEDEDDDRSLTSQELAEMAEAAANNLRGPAFEEQAEPEEAVMVNGKRRTSKATKRRTSTARHHVRSMSALGTKAYAAPEIRKKLRHKTEEDHEKYNEAMTECVADYGMIVDAYSVGWTLRVAMTGVPPNFTISEYMQERENVKLEGEEVEPESFCCCFKQEEEPYVLIREPSSLPHDATLLLASMTEKQPEDRMTVREAQIHPWIQGGDGEEPYQLPQGDVPSHHGDPVIPLKCAPKLSKLTAQYHDLKD